MALTKIAVDGLTLAHKAGSTITAGSFSITSSPSTKVKAEGNGVYKTPLTFTFSGGNFPGAQPGSVATTAPVSIPTTAVKCFAETILVMLEKDFVLMNCVCTPIPPATSPTTCAGQVEISVAGQTKVKAQ